MSRSASFLVFLLLAVASIARGEPMRWLAKNGEIIEGTPVAYHARQIWIEKAPMEVLRLPIGVLSEETLPQLNTWFSPWEEERRAPPLWKDTEGDFVKKVVPRLRRLDGRRLVEADAGELPRPDFVVLYYGANWCPPCHAFVPALNTAHQMWKDAGYENVVIIFVSSDNNSAEQLKYVVDKAMPFYVLEYSRTRESHVRRFAARFVPSMAVLDGHGRPLIVNRSLHADEVLTDLVRLVEASNAWRPKAATTTSMR